VSGNLVTRKLLLVNFTTMTDAHYDNLQCIIFNTGYQSVVTNPIFPKITKT